MKNFEYLKNIDGQFIDGDLYVNGKIIGHQEYKVEGEVYITCSRVATKAKLERTNPFKKAIRVAKETKKKVVNKLKTYPGLYNAMQNKKTKKIAATLALFGSLVAGAMVCKPSSAEAATHDPGYYTTTVNQVNALYPSIKSIDSKDIASTVSLYNGKQFTAGDTKRVERIASLHINGKQVTITNADNKANYFTFVNYWDGKQFNNAKSAIDQAMTNLETKMKRESLYDVTILKTLDAIKDSAIRNYPATYDAGTLRNAIIAYADQQATIIRIKAYQLGYGTNILTAKTNSVNNNVNRPVNNNNNSNITYVAPNGTTLTQSEVNKINQEASNQINNGVVIDSSFVSNGNVEYGVYQKPGIYEGPSYTDGDYSYGNAEYVDAETVEKQGLVDPYGEHYNANGSVSANVQPVDGGYLVWNMSLKSYDFYTPSQYNQMIDDYKNNHGGLIR